MHCLPENARRCDYPVNIVDELRSKKQQRVLNCGCDTVTFLLGSVGCAITRIYFPEDKHTVTSVANPRRVFFTPPASPANYVDDKIMSGGTN